MIELKTPNNIKTLVPEDTIEDKSQKFQINNLKENNDKSMFCIDPNVNFSKSNKRYIKKLSIKKIYNYTVPKYGLNNLYDKKLLKKIKKIKINFIMTNISGDTQEILGLYLRENLKFRSSILCTGGAFSFFSGDQAPINDLIDKSYLVWLTRIIFNPITFFKRYLYALNHYQWL
jgi:N-acetylglucosaminyldiphosphoundecaprenol N-acetyl-beta-D-mannosaminyltransferase